MQWGRGRKKWTEWYFRPSEGRHQLVSRLVSPAHSRVGPGWFPLTAVGPACTTTSLVPVLAVPSCIACPA